MTNTDLGLGLRVVRMFRLKNLECQKKINIYFSKTKMLSSVFNSQDDINILVQRFLKKVDVA